MHIGNVQIHEGKRSFFVYVVINGKRHAVQSFATVAEADKFAMQVEAFKDGVYNEAVFNALNSCLMP
jgi:hypothetical protein